MGNIGGQQEPANIDPRAPVALVVSPHAGGAQREVAADALRRAGVEVGEQLFVSELDGSLPQGARWRERGFRAVVAAGGDGTIGAVASQVAESGLPLGILPMGTSNDVARSFGVPLDLARASAVIASGLPVAMDAGQVVPALTEPYALSVEGEKSGAAPIQNPAMAAQGAYFLHAMTLGLNVAFAQLATDVARRERWGSLTYATSAIEAITQFQPLPVKLHLVDAQEPGATAENTHTLECEVVQVAVVNTPVFGGAMNLRLPSVAPDDRLLDVVVIEALEPHRLRATVEGLLTGLSRLRERFWPGNGSQEPHTVRATSSEALASLGLPGLHYRQVREARIEATQDVDVTLDGEIRARTPAIVRVAAHPIRVLLPRELHELHGIHTSTATGAQAAGK